MDNGAVSQSLRALLGLLTKMSVILGVFLLLSSSSEFVWLSNVFALGQFSTPLQTLLVASVRLGLQRGRWVG